MNSVEANKALAEGQRVYIQAHKMELEVIRIESTGKMLNDSEEWLRVYTPYTTLATTTANRDFFTK